MLRRLRSIAAVFVGELLGAVIIVALFLFGAAKLEHRPPPITPTCATLYSIARSSSDSLYVAMNRADCAWDVR